MSGETPCPFCQEACESGAFLQRHISFKHFNTAVKCAHCEKTFNSEDDFQNHQEKDHSPTTSPSHGPFWCCDEDRGSEANLKIHKKYAHDAAEKDDFVGEKSKEVPSTTSNGIAKKTDKPVFDAEKWLKSREENRRSKQAKHDEVIVESDSILDDSTRKQKVVETVDLISRKNKLPEQDDEVIVESDTIQDDSTHKQKVVETIASKSRKHKKPEIDDEVVIDTDSNMEQEKVETMASKNDKVSSKDLECPLCHDKKSMKKFSPGHSIRFHLFSHYTDNLSDWESRLEKLEKESKNVYKCDSCDKVLSGATENGSKKSIICHLAVQHHELRPILEQDSRLNKEFIENLYFDVNQENEGVQEIIRNDEQNDSTTRESRLRKSQSKDVVHSKKKSKKDVVEIASDVEEIEISDNELEESSSDDKKLLNKTGSKVSKLSKQQPKKKFKEKNIVDEVRDDNEENVEKEIEKRRRVNKSTNSKNLDAKDGKKSDSGNESENEDSDEQDIDKEEKNKKDVTRKPVMKTESSKTTPSSNISATYICYTNNCNRKFTKLADMYDHEEQEHDKKRKYNCGECKKRFFENNHLNDHNKAVHNIISETPMTPTIEKKDQEKRKIAKTTSVSEKESDTEDKNDDNSSKSSNNTKKNNAAPEKIKTECYHCHKITVTKDNNGLCDKCDKKLSPVLILTRIKEDSIKPLLQTSTPTVIPSDAVSSKKNAATFECDKCEKSYQSKKSLNRHIQSSHEITKEDVSVEVPVKINKKKNEGLGLASTICNICERFFITKEALESHTSEKHNDQVKRKREDTTKEDSEVEESNPPPTKRRSHKLYTPNVLDEEKENQSYECDKCPNPKKFFRKDAYDRHLANVHD